MEGLTEIATDSPMSLGAGRHAVVSELQHITTRKKEIHSFFFLFTGVNSTEIRNIRLICCQWTNILYSLEPAMLL